MTKELSDKMIDAVMNIIDQFRSGSAEFQATDNAMAQLRTALESIEAGEVKMKENPYSDSDYQDEDDYEIPEPDFDYANSEVIDQGKVNDINDFEYDVTVRRDIHGVVLYSLERDFTLYAKPLDQFPKTDSFKVNNPDDLFPGPTKL